METLFDLTSSDASDAESGSARALGYLGSVGEEQLFPSGTLLAQRYVVIECLGRGGMGEVYEAQDEELGLRVAVKTLRKERLGDERSLARFRREIALARRVTHPNVARTFDVSLHHEGGAGSRDITLLTMELLRGHSLAERIRSHGAMTVEDTLPIVCQIASGLAAAHRAGVLHRDLKCDNVVLVPEGEGLFRAVITDFGLARPLDAGSLAPDLTRDGSFVGTPAYMAPEQVEGRPLGEPADVFALGVVVFHMLSATLPFVADTPEATAIRRLTHPPAGLRDRVSTVPARWENAIRSCLARNPEERPTLDAFVARLSGTHAGRLTARTRLSAYVVAAVLAGLVAAGCGVFWLGRPHGTTTVPSLGRPASRKSMAVAGLVDASTPPDAAWLGVALGELLANGLASDEVRSVPYAEVTATMHELGITKKDGYDRATLGQMSRGLGVDSVVSGSYIVSGPPLARHVRLAFRAQFGETTNEQVIVEEGTEADLAELVARAAARLRSAFGLKLPARIGSGALRATLPLGRMSAELYTESISLVARHEAAPARERLERLTALAPEFAPAHALLSEVYTALHEEARARSAMERAFECATPLAREERLAIEARYHFVFARWAKANEIYRALHTVFPDEPGYGLGIARAQINAGRSEDALATLTDLRREFHGPANAVSLDLYEALATSKLGDGKRTLEAAKRAQTTARDLGMRALEAAAHARVAEALDMLGRAPEAERESADAERLYVALGNDNAVATLWRRRGLRSLAQGDTVDARAILDRAASVFERVGNRYQAAGVLNAIGQTEVSLGRLSSARQLYNRATVLYREAGDREGVANIASNDATALREMGAIQQATKVYEEARTALFGIGAHGNAINSQIELATTTRLKGDVKTARELVDDALSRGRALQNSASEIDGLAVLGDVLYDTGDRQAAREAYAASLDKRTQAGEGLGRAENLLGLARVAIEEQRLAEAEVQVAAAFAAAATPVARTAETEALVREVEARLLLARGRRADARATVERAFELTQTAENKRVRIAVESARAFIYGLEGASLPDASGEPMVAERALEALIVESQHLGLVTASFEARLDLARLSRARGLPSANARATALAHDAVARGLLRIAAHARSAQ